MIGRNCQNDPPSIWIDLPRLLIMPLAQQPGASWRGRDRGWKYPRIAVQGFAQWQPDVTAIDCQGGRVGLRPGIWPVTARNSQPKSMPFRQVIGGFIKLQRYLDRLAGDQVALGVEPIPVAQVQQPKVISIDVPSGLRSHSRTTNCARGRSADRRSCTIERPTISVVSASAEPSKQALRASSGC